MNDYLAVLDRATADLFDLDVKTVPVPDIKGLNTTTDCTDDGCTKTCTSRGCSKTCNCGTQACTKKGCK
jgi:hypothetical protein